MATKQVTLKVKGGLEVNVLPILSTLEARELAITTDTGKLYVGTGAGNYKLLNGTPDYGFSGDKILVTDANGNIIESTVAAIDLEAVDGLDTTINDIQKAIKDLQDNKQNRLTGTEGNLVDFGADNNPKDAGKSLQDISDEIDADISTHDGDANAHPALRTRIKGNEDKIKALENKTKNYGTMADQSKDDYRTKNDQDTIDATHLVKTDIAAGLNVVISPDAASNKVTISVPGVPLPDKFSSSEDGSGTIGSTSTFNSTMLNQISGEGILSIGDVIIFANGYQGEVIAIDTTANTYQVTIISVPQDVAWGGIGGTITNQTDLVAELAKKADKTTKVAGKALSADVNLGKLQLKKGTTVQIEYDGSVDKALDLAALIEEYTDLKVDLVPTATENNIAVFNADGGVKDSGIGYTKLLSENDILDGGTI